MRKPRNLLHSIIDDWEQGLGDKKFIDSDQYPSIADIVNIFTLFFCYCLSI